MRANTNIFIFIFFAFSGSSFCQNLPPKHLAYPDKQGVWTFTLYAADIIKTTFSPFGYKKNEQVSNAVITRPSAKSIKFSGVEVFDNKDGVIRFKYSGKKLLLLNYFDSINFKGFKFQLDTDERIFGTGERSIPLNRRGYKLNLYNNPWYGYGMNADNLNYSVPFIISSNGYGIFFDNPSKSYLDIGKTDPAVLEYGASSGVLTFYIIAGKNVDEIVRNYQSLVGTQPIPARWVFGNLMSRFGYRSQRQLMNTVAMMKKENFPIDAVILDLFWFGDSIKNTMGNLDWVNKKAWPDPVKMISILKRQHINTILITEPFVLNSTPNFQPSKKFHAVDSAGNPFLLTDFYFGHGGLLDIFRKDAQDWFWSKYKPQIVKGVAGWWGDLGEPEKHPASMYHNLKDLGYKRLFSADEVHNIYGHYWDKMLFEKYAKEYPGVRLFNLNRSGYAGSPRYNVFPWSGDVSRSWDGLNAQLPLMISMSMSGVPFIHADAGGFAGGEGDEELYTRWLQFAVFTPIFRPHGTALEDLDTTIKNIPSEGALHTEPYKSIVRKAYELRYQLLPYNYTLAYEQAKFGKPLVRPLFYYDNSDSNLYKAADEFMWGDELLVCHVLEKNATTRKIYLPEGDWYNFNTGKKTEGHQWITEKVDLQNIPVFVKEGSFIPMFISSSAIQSTADYKGNDLTIKYFPSSKKTNYVMYDDDGKTNNTLVNGKYQLISFKGNSTGKNINIQVYEATNSGIKRNMKLELPGDVEIVSVKINTKLLNPDELKRIMDPKKNSFRFLFTSDPVNIEIQLR